MFGIYKNMFPVAPLTGEADGEPGHRVPQRLASTGATETATSRPLTPGKMYVLLVGSAGVRVRFSGSRLAPGSVVSATRDVVYGPWSQVPFVAESGRSLFVAVEAADGTAAYECFVVAVQN